LDPPLIYTSTSIPASASDQLTGWYILGGTAVVVTTGACGRGGVLTIGVAVGAVDLAVYLIEQQTSDRVLKVCLRPTAVAAAAGVIQPRDLFAGRVAGAAIEVDVIAVEGPAGFCVGECRFLFGAVAFRTRIALMAIVAKRVHFFLGLGDFHRRLQIVAAAAVFLLMAIHTAQPKQIDVFLVEESDDRTVFIWGLIDFRVRFGQFRMCGAHDVGHIADGLGHRLAGLRRVADHALRVMRPFTVAGEALAMIRALQTRLAQIGFGFGAMALAARRDASRRTEVMAGLAVSAHLGHAGMAFVIEMHRLIEIRDLAEHDRIRAFAKSVCSGRVD